jgi:hypothetical protein
LTQTDTGDYLISSRHFSSVILVSDQTGDVAWVLDGRLNQFEDLSEGQATNFRWQHDARIHATADSGDNGGDTVLLTLFDNHQEGTESCTGSIKCVSRSLELEIDMAAKTARLVKQHYHPEAVNSGAMGGVQRGANGNTLVSWRTNPAIVEYDGVTGDVSMDVQLGPIGDDYKQEVFSYRARRGQWVGWPPWAPDMFAESYDGGAVVYVSWNGATEVKKWAIVSGITKTPNDSAC